MLTKRDLFRSAALVAMTGAAANSGPARAQTAATSSGFSFAAVGDSRPMMYLPTRAGRPDVVKLSVEMFGLVMPEKMAEAVVQRDVKMIFDPVTKELVQVVMPFMSKTEVMTLKVSRCLGFDSDRIRLRPVTTKPGRWPAQHIESFNNSRRASGPAASRSSSRWRSSGIRRRAIRA